MSWCVLTERTKTGIDIASHLRHRHTPRTTWRGKRCSHCRARWGRYGCSPYLWATDYLSSLSKLLVPDRPQRPKSGRHRPSYTRRLRDHDETVRTQLACVRLRPSTSDQRGTHETTAPHGTVRTAAGCDTAAPSATSVARQQPRHGPSRSVRPGERAPGHDWQSVGPARGTYAVPRARTTAIAATDQSARPAPRPTIHSGPRTKFVHNHQVEHMNQNRNETQSQHRRRIDNTTDSVPAHDGKTASADPKPSRPSVMEIARHIEREAEKAALSRAGILQPEELGEYEPKTNRITTPEGLMMDSSGLRLPRDGYPPDGATASGAAVRTPSPVRHAASAPGAAPAPRLALMRAAQAEPVRLAAAARRQSAEARTNPIPPNVMTIATVRADMNRTREARARRNEEPQENRGQQPGVGPTSRRHFAPVPDRGARSSAIAEIRPREPQWDRPGRDEPGRNETARSEYGQYETAQSEPDWTEPGRGEWGSPGPGWREMGWREPLTDSAARVPAAGLTTNTMQEPAARTPGADPTTVAGPALSPAAIPRATPAAAPGQFRASTPTPGRAPTRGPLPTNGAVAWYLNP